MILIEFSHQSGLEQSIGGRVGPPSLYTSETPEHCGVGVLRCSVYAQGRAVIRAPRSQPAGAQPNWNHDP